MSEPATTTSKVAFSQRPAGKLGCAIAFLFLGALISMMLGLTIWLEVAASLVCGWIYFLLENISTLSWNWEMLGCSLAALALGTWGLHRLCLWLRQSKVWKWSWTLSITTLTMVLFASSIAMTGIIHQFGWMSREPFTRSSHRSLLTLNVSNAKQMFYLMVEYDENFGEMPYSPNAFEKEGYTTSLYQLQFQPEGGGPSEPWIMLGGGDSLFSEKDGKPQQPEIIMISPHPIYGKWVVLMDDGSVKTLLSQSIRKQHAYVLQKLPNLLPEGM